MARLKLKQINDLARTRLLRLLSVSVSFLMFGSAMASAKPAVAKGTGDLTREAYLKRVVERDESIQPKILE